MKNSKIKIDTGSEKLSKEEINTHKDFNKVYKTYTTTKTNTFKVPKKFGGMTTIVVVTTTVVVTTIGAWKYWSSHSSSKQPPVTASSSNSNKTSSASSSTTTDNHVAKHPYINPPVKGVNVPYKAYSVDAAKGGTLTYNNSKLVIPAAAFCDEKGKDITGKVDIKYREFRNALDFFTSGIPMTYDSAGKQYTFESAGMLDVRGYQNGKPVYIKTGKDIKVAMITTQKNISYNVYQLDTVKQNWNYVSTSKGVPIPVKGSAKKDTGMIIPDAEKPQVQQIQNNIASIKQDEAKIEKTKPVEIKKATPGKNTFDIEADAKDYPELGLYKNLLWEPDPSDNSYKPAWATITLEDASLKRNTDGTTYNFTVKKGSESHSFLVRPVFAGKDYDAAKKEYDKKYQEYQVAYDARKAEEKKQKDTYDALMAKIKKEQEAEQNRIIAQNTAWAVTNYFTINNFGIWNSDCPGALPVGAELAAQYTDNNKDNLNGNDFYLVEKDKNALFIYHPGHNCRFNPKMENFAWSVTPDNKIAIYTIKDFEKIEKRHGDFTFNLNIIDKKIASADDIKEIFKPYM